MKSKDMQMAGKHERGAGAPQEPTTAEDSPPTSDPANPLAREVSGTDDGALAERLVAQATGAVTDYVGVEINMGYAVAALRVIGPKDGLEGLLATEIVGMHSIAMEFARRSASREQTSLG